MPRKPSKSGDIILEHHTKAIMELTSTLRRNEENLEAIKAVVDKRTQNPIVLAKIITALLDMHEQTEKSMETAVKHIQVAEAIRLEESPRSIAAKRREADKK